MRFKTVFRLCYDSVNKCRNHKQYFRTPRRFAPGGRLGHDRIGLCGHIFGYLITLCSYCKNPVNIGITYIPSADLNYGIVVFYSLSRINQFLNINNCIVFLNTLIINVNICTILYCILRVNMSWTTPIHILIILFTQIARYHGRFSLGEKNTGHVRTPCADMPRTMWACPHKNILLHFAKYVLFLAGTFLL